MVGVAVLALVSTVQASTPRLLDAGLISPNLAMVHLSEGYVKHHGMGQKNSDDQVICSPLDLQLLSSLSNFSMTVGSGPDRSVKQIHRKSKGTDFAWFTDRWVGDHAENDRPDHIKEHWIYLSLPQALKPGEIGTLRLPYGLCDKAKVQIGDGIRSEAIHVNQLGYQPQSKAKFAYIYHWAGDLGSVDFSDFSGKRFQLVNEAGSVAFEGPIRFRMKKDAPETSHLSDSKPFGNFLKADVYECDFSAYSKPGRYRVKVKGLGTSFPFDIKSDAMRSAYVATARALFHNRSGIILKPPFAEFTRPAPHNPNLTPGFKGKLQYSRSRYLDWSTEDSTPADKAAIESKIVGPLDAYGWYQDAGDWDSYPSHLRVATELLIAYQIAPRNFGDGDLNIPESGNGLPDLLDEAMWLPRFAYRLRHELLTKKYGTGGLSLRVCGDQFGPDGEGTPSWKDVNRTWVVAGEDPVSTFRYAGAAAHLAVVLRDAKLSDPSKIDWRREAAESYAWAVKNTLPADEPKVKDYRSYAAAALFCLTGEELYQQQLRQDWTDIQKDTIFWGDRQYGLELFALSATKAEPDLLQRVRGSILATANRNGPETASKRALRWGGNLDMPMLVGQQTTPLCLEVAVAMKLTEKSDPARSSVYASVLQTTADYFLGTNALNMVWMTGVGSRHVEQIFHLDDWCLGKFPAGYIPYGPWRVERPYGNGPWDKEWANKTAYPAIDQWPGNEMWFSNRCAPMSSEFTVHQNLGPAAAFYGLLSGPAKRHP